MDHSTPFQNQSSLGFEGSRSGSLGIVTKTTSPLTATGVSPSEIIDTSTGEIFNVSDFSLRIVDGFVSPSEAEQKQIARASRWGLKSVVNKLLPDIRTSKCMVLRAPVIGGGLSDINVCRGSETKKAFYHGLMTCGSIWTCPVCAAKISERRRQELKSALQVAEQKDLKAHFVTLTFPHGISDDLNDILSKMSQAFKRLSAGKYSVKNSLARISPDLSIEGFIRAIEVTHGKNGFHPHIHMIVFTNSDTYSSYLQMVYSTAWSRACTLAGLPAPSELHGCTVQDGSQAAEYVSKWGMEDEMTKANSKKGKTKGLSPWGLLSAALDGDNPDYPAKKAGDLFRVYARAFKGRRQLYWSNGLRNRLELAKEVTDEELADAPEQERASVLATLSTEQWKKIRAKKAESILLNIAESRPDLVSSFIDKVTGIKDPDYQKETSNFVDRSVANTSLDEMTNHALARLEEYKYSSQYFNAVMTRERGRAKTERMTSDQGYGRRRSTY